MGSVRGGWYFCPCGQRLFRVREDAVLINHTSYCKKCRRTYVVTLAFGHVVAESENDIKTEPVPSS